MGFQHVLFEVRDGVARLTLNRPDRLNSFNDAMHAEVREALAALRADASVRVMLLTGAGRGFCAGQDLGDRAVAPGGAAVDLGASIERNYRPLVLALRTLPVPTICAVNGVAAGAGANFALLCDVVVAARSASFIQAFSKIGLVPDCGGSWLLPRLVGRANALALAMLGDKLGAEDAVRLGLIWKCVDDAAFPAEVEALAARLATLPTRALVATRQALDASQHLDLAAALSLEADVQRTLGAAHDFQEGVAAFLAKRAPVFADR